MERWNLKRKEFLANPKIDQFIEEVLAVCKKHGLSIGHEDWEGSFEITPHNVQAEKWLRDANDDT